MWIVKLWLKTCLFHYSVKSKKTQLLGRIASLTKLRTTVHSPSSALQYTHPSPPPPFPFRKGLFWNRHVGLRKRPYRQIRPADRLYPNISYYFGAGRGGLTLARWQPSAERSPVGSKNCYIKETKKNARRFVWSLFTRKYTSLYRSVLHCSINGSAKRWVRL